MNNYRILVLFDASMCAPMTDPETKMPRTRWDDGRGFITEQAIKFRIKKYLKESGEKILHYEDREDYTVFKELNAYKLTEEEAKEKACQYLDVRLFGAMDLATDKSKGSEGKKGRVLIEGPVSVGYSLTEDPITLHDVATNRQYKVDINEDGSNQGSSYGNVSTILEYGLYSCFIGVNNIKSKVTGLTDSDVELLIDAIVHMFDNDYSCMRPLGSMNVRHVFVWKWGEKETGCADWKLIDSVKIEHKEGILKPSRYADYIISVDEVRIPVKDYIAY